MIYAQGCHVMAMVGADSHPSALSTVCFPFPLEQETRLEGVCPWGGSAAFSYSAEYIYIVHGGLVRADDHLGSTDDPLKWFPRTHGGVAAPRCDCAAVDAFKGSSAGWCLGLAFRSSLASCSLFRAVFTVVAAFFLIHLELLKAKNLVAYIREHRACGEGGDMEW